jgi:uncharacterized protein YeeX (DUF496 family)
MSPALYRTDVQAAVRIFRPVLKALNIRNSKKYRPVYFSEFLHLDFLNLDYCSIEILIADLDDCVGLFVSSYTKKKLLRNYLILNSSLFSEHREITEKLKITAVHEFCHFLAIIYALTTVSIEELKERIAARLTSKIDKLPNETIVELYTLLSSKAPKNTDLDEATDKHFRLDYEDSTIDYYILFCHLLFSRELFETEFDIEKQKEFKHLFNQRAKNAQDRAIVLLLESLEKVCEEKSILYSFAYKQLIKWAYKYT